MDFVVTLGLGLAIGSAVGLALALLLIAALERLGKAIQDADEWEDL